MSFLMSFAFTVSLTSVVFILSLGLTAVMGLKAAKVKSRSLQFWFSGMAVFTLSVLLEIIFAIGYYPALLLKSYLFLVAAIVELLALGSVSLARSGRNTMIYSVYVIITSIFLIYTLASGTLGKMIISHVFFGPLPILVTVASSLITFPAAVIILVKAALDFRKTHNPSMISIIVGVIVVSVAGTLYITGFPSFLYLAEFIGIFLLWFGFVRIPNPLRRSQPAGT
jgi:hypothetical protein